MMLTDPREGERLEILVDPVAVPQVGVWINLAAGGRRRDGRRRTTTWRWSRASARRTGWRTRCWDGERAQTLAPGEERGWEVVVRLPDRRESP